MVSLLTYTHSKASDVHKAYFGRLNKYYPTLQHNYVTCNELIDGSVGFHGKCIVYDDSSSYSEQMINALRQIETDYVIYCQEDYILFNHVNTDLIESYVRLMDADDGIGFVRLLKSGVGVANIQYKDDLYYVGIKDNQYYFSTQATIWKRQVLISMFLRSMVKSIFDEVKNTPHLLDLGVYGLYSENVGSLVGGHYNSKAFPYIATAIVKGNWNVSEYREELNMLFREYSINPYERGIR